jgi:glycosyltransferase involved in cell wall biosynthesis
VTASMGAGGVEAFILRLGARLAQRCTVDVITTEDRGLWFDEMSGLGIRSLHIGYGGLTRLGHFAEVGSALARGRYDLIFLNHARYAQASLAMLPDSVPVIPIIHGDSDAVYRVACANSGSWNVAVAVSPRVWRTACSRAPAKPIVRIDNGVPLPDSASLGSRARFARPVRVAFVGRLHEGKGVRLLAEIVSQCQRAAVEMTLTVAGDGPELAGFVKQVRHLGIRDKVEILGAVSRDRVYALLLQSHLLLLPTSHEGMPIAVLEAMACGCVPIVSRLPGITDAIITDGKDGFLVDDVTVPAFVQAIAAVTRKPERWGLMSQAVHERLGQSDFTLDQMVASYWDLIEDAVSGKYPLTCSRKEQPRIDESLTTLRDHLPLLAINACRRLKHNLESRRAGRVERNIKESRPSSPVGDLRHWRSL